MPVYHVRQTITDPNRTGAHVDATIEAERLVDADNKSAAIRHVAADTITAEPASIANAMRLSKAGVTVEKAGK